MLYTKGVPSLVSRYFVSTDFDCKCEYEDCVTTDIDGLLPDRLDVLWDDIGPLRVDSGYRCERHNREIGGSPNSQHLIGRAADIKSERQMLGIAIEGAAKKIEAFNKGGIGTAYSWVHLDIRESGPARWHYPYSWSNPKRVEI